MYIGIDVGGTKISAGLVKNGKVLKKIVIEEKIRDRTHFLEIIFYLIDGLYNKKVNAIGIGVPALVQNYSICEPVNLGFIDSLKLSEIIEKKYKVKLRIANDAKCFALGELLFGSAKKFDNSVCLTIGTGLGGAIIINKKIYLGKNHGAGEFGAIRLENSLLEDACSGKFFITKGNSGANFYTLARKNNKKALKVFNEYGLNLGKALALIVCSLNPQAIILGGSVSNSFVFFKKSMMVALKKFTYKKSFEGLKLIKSKNLDYGIIGAAYLCNERTKNFFS